MADTHLTQAPSHKAVRKVLDRFRVDSGKGFALAEFATRFELPGMADKEGAKAALQAGVERLAKLQDKLYPQQRWAVLIVFQAMDAGGKDGTIKHVLSGVNPQGVHVTSFKPPGPEELAHDFLWRVSKALPARGMIGIFNRSQYEEVLVTRVKPELLEAQRLPAELVGGKHFWEHRLESIAGFERHLAREGTVILKFFLNISKEEQRLRLLARMEEKSKAWKFSLGDLDDRERWGDFMQAYEAVIAGTAAKHAPWYVIPADDKPIARLLVVEAINEALERLDLHRPKLSAEQEAQMEEARRRLGVG
jgi:PPK2 family polyphosphate:nucleotide phosphotransferase